ncbi:LuxR C-terminal-related transcriptional regulator [Candidatus Leptofilum sp.]|uniref:LuxR C-terminal-related transcriptional regulator n=1 Tax=Candidatus Leptofilum sp. TaxID=3241576 RepID=UPI003B58B953
MIQILVVNRTRLICSIMASALRDEPDLQVVGYATSIEEAIEKAESCEIMAIDVHMPDDGALELTKKIAEKYPGIRVVITGVEEEPQTILSYIEAGAKGYVLEKVDIDELVESIRAIHKDQSFASPDMVMAFMTRLNMLSKMCADLDGLAELIEELTPREKEVLDFLGEGMSNQAIADELCIEVGTVKNHVHNILKKLEVDSRYEAAALYDQTQLINGKNEE